MAEKEETFGRIQYDADQLDEVVLHDCMFHIERMSHHGWWMAVYRDEKRISFWFRMMSEPVMMQDMGQIPGVLTEIRDPLVYFCPVKWVDSRDSAHRCDRETSGHSRHRCECGATTRGGGK